MRIKTNGNKRDSVYTVIRNAEATLSIPAGTPVTLVMNGTNDGLDVVLPNTAGDAKNGAFRYGVATSALVAGNYGEAIVYGFCPYALITRATRAATSDSWTSSASSASGVALGYESVNNAFQVNASMVGSLGTLKAGAVLVDSIASMAASATATTDTRTAITVGVRAFIRMM